MLSGTAAVVGDDRDEPISPISSSVSRSASRRLTRRPASAGASSTAAIAPSWFANCRHVPAELDLLKSLRSQRSATSPAGGLVLVEVQLPDLIRPGRPGEERRPVGLRELAALVMVFGDNAARTFSAAGITRG